MNFIIKYEMAKQQEFLSLYHNAKSNKLFRPIFSMEHHPTFHTSQSIMIAYFNPRIMMIVMQKKNDKLIFVKNLLGKILLIDVYKISISKKTIVSCWSLVCTSIISPYQRNIEQKGWLGPYYITFDDKAWCLTSDKREIF